MDDPLKLQNSADKATVPIVSKEAFGLSKDSGGRLVAHAVSIAH